MENDANIAALIADLDHSDKPRIRAAVDALILIAGNSEGLRATLEQLLDDPRRKNRWPVAYILGHFPQPSGAVVQCLLEGLDHREPDIRWAIALLLVRMARTEGNLVNPLVHLCRTGTANQKRMAIYCIRDLELTDSVSLLALLEALRDRDPTVRVAGVTSLKARPDIDANGKNVLFQLFVKDSDIRVRNAAAVTLAQLGAPSEEFLAALAGAAQSENSQLKKSASAALALLQNKRSAPSGS